MKRIKILVILILFVSSIFNCNAQLAITPYLPQTNPIANLITALGGTGSNIFNVKTNIVLDTTSVIGTFTNPSGVGFGNQFKKGIVLGTGNVSDIMGTESTFISTDYKLPGDAFLDNYTTAATQDAVYLEFDFIPYNDTISFSYIFGSEEYPQYVGSTFNDVFAFEISGNEYITPQNIALIPGTSTPVTINNVNSGINAQYFVDNTLSSSPLTNTVTLNGLTKTLRAFATVTPCKTYHLKLSIADAGDGQLDSDVFIGALDLGNDNSNAIVGDTNVCIGQNAIIKVQASTSVTAQKWQRFNTSTNTWDYLVNDAVYSGVNTTSLAITNATYMLNNSQFRVELKTSTCGFIFSPVSKFTVGKPKLTINAPQNITLCALVNNNNLGFRAKTTGIPTGINVNYQWQVQALGATTFTNITNGVNYSGVNTDSLTLLTNAADGNKYRLSIISNAGLGCIDTLSNVATITINPLPPVTATPSFAICPGASATLSGGGASTYVWDNGITNGTPFSPIATKTYTVTGTDVNGCKNTATSVVTINPLPTVTATPSFAICTGSSATLSGAGASTYIWDNGITNGTAFSPIATKTYTLTGTDVNGCKNTATSVVTINSLPTVTPTPSFAICTGASATLNGSGASTYTWDNGITNGTAFSPIATKTYTVTGTDVNGCKNTATSVVTINPLPPVTATPSFAICPGASATLSGGGASTYTWDNGITNGTPFSPIATKTYTVTGTDVNGCKNTATSVVTINPLPTVTATPSFAICTGASATLSGAGASTYIWDNGITNGTAFSPIATKTYTVTGTDANGCKNTATSVVTIKVIPNSPLVTNPAAICQFSTAPNLITSVTGANLNWYDVALGGTALGSAPIASSLTVGKFDHWVSQTIDGCESAREIVTYQINSAPSIPIVTPQYNICQNNAVPIISVNTGGNTANWYTTATGSTAQNATPIISSATIGQKSHWVSAIALGCESLRAKIDINVLANPDLSAIVPALICQGDTLNVNLSFSGMAPFNLLYSNTGHNGNIISAKSDFTFYLLPDVDGNVEFITLTDSNCVTSYNNYINNFFVNQLPKLSLQGFDTICDKQFIDIEFKSDLLSANYAWTVSQSNTAIKVLNNFSNGIEIKQQLQNLLQSVQEIKYTVTAYNGNCIGESKTKVITVMPSYLPSLNDTMPTVCKGSSLVLDAGNSPVGYKTQWYKNDVIMNNELSTKLPIVVNDNDFYKIVATNYCGVEDEASTSVSIYDRQHLTQLKTIDSCATFVSAFEINTGTLLDNTKWTIENNVYDDKVVNQKSNMNHTFLDVSIYDLSIQGYYGTCLLADTSFKFKTVDCSVKLTNTFTPNGDQANDWWYISGIENFPNASIDIFNRWGIKIKSINKNIPNLAWDGYNSEGQLMENGTYYYVLRFDMGKQPIKGYINLLR